MDLKTCREKLDVIDRQLVTLLEERMKISAFVAEDKLRTGKPILDAEREKQKLDAVEEMTEGDAHKAPMRAIFAEIMRSSRQLQEAWQKGER
ncbi:MAG: chorismate mutase [Lachnospiraceae bacterium]|nr:chorismate mutase [Lachnospiraceae bacterium]